MSAWTDATWDAFCALVEEAWPGEFDDDAQRAWRVLLGGLPAEDGIEGLKRLLFEGHTFRPSVSEFLAAVRHDPSQPTFGEACRMIYGRGGVLAAKPDMSVFTEPERAQARLAKAHELHPLIASFVDRQTIAKLTTLHFGDPKYGEANRAALEREWNDHVQRFNDRDVAALAAGETERTRRLERFDPMVALRGAQPVALPAGAGAEG